MAAALLVAFLWAAFAGTHIWLSSASVRRSLLARLGPQGFQGLYSLVAFATFVPLIWVFATHKHAGPLLWSTLGPPAVARGLNYALMVAALMLFAASLLPASAPPSAMYARGPATVRGVLRVTRHPMLSAFAIFGVAHLLVNGSLTDVAFFGGFPLFAWIGARHQDARKGRDVAGYDALVAATSIVPFGAIASGRQRFVWNDLPLAVLVVGLVLTVVIRTYHRQLFGP